MASRVAWRRSASVRRPLRGACREPVAARAAGSRRYRAAPHDSRTIRDGRLTGACRRSDRAIRSGGHVDVGLWDRHGRSGVVAGRSSGVRLEIEATRVSRAALGGLTIQREVASGPEVFGPSTTRHCRGLARASRRDPGRCGDYARDAGGRRHGGVRGFSSGDDDPVTRGRRTADFLGGRPPARLAYVREDRGSSRLDAMAIYASSFSAHRLGGEGTRSAPWSAVVVSRCESWSGRPAG